MRISDWSSDVCSSDLLAGRLLARLLEQPFDIAVRQDARQGPPRGGARDVERRIVRPLALIEQEREELPQRRQFPRCAARRQRLIIGHQFAQSRSIRIAEREIGSASCRESVCLYVYI